MKIIAKKKEFVLKWDFKNPEHVVELPGCRILDMRDVCDSIRWKSQKEKILKKMLLGD